MLGLGDRSVVLQAASADKMRESQPPVEPQLTRFLAPHVLALAAVMFLAGCTGGQAKKVADQQAAPLPTLDLRATVTVLDAETGEPVPDAWVLVITRVTTDRPAPSGHLEAAAGARSVTSPMGTASIHKVEGTYYPGEPKGKAWHVMELSRTERLGPMKLTGIQGGSLVIASAKYGFVHQPFVVEDDPTYQDWLTKNRREDYNGWLGRDTMRKQLPLLSVRTNGLREGIALTIKMRRPASLDEWANMISPVVFWNSTWVGMGKDAGATEDEQRRIYWLFARQLDQIGLMSGKTEHVESFAVYLREEAIKLYLNHGLKNPDQQGAIQLWLARKALEVVPPDATEVKEHVGAILKGVEEEGRDPRWQYHYQSPNDPAVGLPGFDSAMRWAGLDQDNAKNEWDWQDAQRYYRAGDREKAYLALGHVLRLLTNLAIPKYTTANQMRRTAFEEAVEGALAANGGSLPPEYWHSVREPAFALTPGVRFQAVAGGERKAGQGSLEVRGAAVMSDALNDVGGAKQSLAMAKYTFPQAIAQGAGLLSDFHRLMHPAAHVQLPGNGNGNGGPQGVQQSSGTNSGSATDATGGPDRARKAKSDTGAAPDGTGLSTAGGSEGISNPKSLTPAPDAQGLAKRIAEDFLGRLKQLGENKPIVKLVEDDPGVRAVIDAFDQAVLDERALVEIQKIGCAETDALAILVCGQAEGRLHKIWPLGKFRRVEFYTERLLPIVNDKTAPPRMRAEYALDIIMDLTGMREHKSPRLPDKERIEIARGMASLMNETTEGARHMGLEGCMHFGADVSECEAGVEAALKSLNEDFRHLATHYFSSGAKSQIQMHRRGLKGPLNGKAQRRILAVAYEMLSEGSARYPERVVATLAQSISFLGNPLIEDLADEIPKIVLLLANLQKHDPSALVRYRAYEGLYNLSTFGAAQIKVQTQKLIEGFDPREDEVKALGGPGPFSTIFQKRDEKE